MKAEPYGAAKSSTFGIQLQVVCEKQQQPEEGVMDTSAVYAKAKTTVKVSSSNGIALLLGGEIRETC